MTTALLLLGAAAAVLFAAVLIIEGARRPGYNPVYHTGSELSLGKGGWIQRASFLQMGVGSIAFGLGVGRATDSPIAAALIMVFGLGLVVAGVFVPDAVRGFPPGAPAKRSSEPSREDRVHGLAPIGFLALFAACLVLASELQGAWRVYTVVTAIVGLALTVSTAAAVQRDAAFTGLIQRALIAVYWTWIFLLAIHLA